MEIIQEYDNWRRVRDAEGAEGWINQSLLSGQRTAVVAPWQQGKDDVQVNALWRSRTQARESSRLSGAGRGRRDLRLQRQLVRDGSSAAMRGWISQTQVWGAYPGETYRD